MPEEIRIDDPPIGGTVEDYTEEIPKNEDKNEDKISQIADILDKGIVAFAKALKPTGIQLNKDKLKKLLDKNHIDPVMSMGMLNLMKNRGKEKEIVKSKGLNQKDLAEITDLMIKQNSLFYSFIMEMVKMYEQRESIRKEKTQNLIEKGFEVLTALVPQLTMLSQIAKNKVMAQQKNVEESWDGENIAPSKNTKQS